MLRRCFLRAAGAGAFGLGVAPSLMAEVVPDVPVLDSDHLALARQMAHIYPAEQAKDLQVPGFCSPLGINVYCDKPSTVQALMTLPGFAVGEELWTKYLTGLVRNELGLPNEAKASTFAGLKRRNLGSALYLEDMSELGVTVYSGMHRISLGIIYRPDYPQGYKRMLTMQMFVPKSELGTLEESRRVFASSAATLLRSLADSRDPWCVHHSAVGFQQYVYDGGVLADCLNVV